MSTTTDGKTLLLFGNEWGLAELPRLRGKVDAARWGQWWAGWSFAECMEKLKAAGFDGCQAAAARAADVRAHGLRFAASERVNVPADADPAAARCADAGAECVTLHLGWGLETDHQIDALLDAVLAAQDKRRIPLYVETHRATCFQDLSRIRQALSRRPAVRLNGDFSHLYCGGEMTYQGFETTREYLRPLIERTRFMHGRVSDAERMQIDVGDGTDNVHAANFGWIWREVFRAWRASGEGREFIFCPELGPPSSNYSVWYRDDTGAAVETSDRWEQTLVLKRLAEKAFAESAA